jgi:hypothetical protein
MNRDRLSEVLYQYRAYRANEVDVFRAFIEELGAKPENGRCRPDALEPVVIHDGLHREESDERS